MLTSAQAWDILGRVPDPEIPVISVTELGIVRDVQAADDGVDVVVTPTYSGCPATEVIERSIREALTAAGAAEVRVRRSWRRRGPPTGSSRARRSSCARTASRRPATMAVGEARPL